LLLKTVAKFAIVSSYFAFATIAAATHKDQAFQASSPKTFSRPSGRLFFGPLAGNISLPVFRAMPSDPRRAA
jgi:hypothetical protein